MAPNAPWLEFYGDIPHTLDYPDCSMADYVFEKAKAYDGLTAIEFFGIKTDYPEFIAQVHDCARALAAVGITPGDRVTVCMPNTPQAVIMFYAINVVGAVANMVHPLSAEEELVSFINGSKSRLCLTLNQFYPKLQSILDRLCIEKLVLSGIEDGLRGIKRPLYTLTQGRKLPRPESGGKLLRYTDFMELGRAYKGEYEHKTYGDDVAVILYSGGTSGTTKGIELTNRNFNALTMQTGALGDCIVTGNSMLSVMPVFHGFGLGICVHLALLAGVKCMLVPQFSVKSYAQLLKKLRPNYIIGVPTLFEALLRLKGIAKLDLSQLQGVFSGGDSLSVELKRKVDAFLREHGAKEQVREGYGLTECVTASCLTPKNMHKEGSIGIPFPDTFYKIVEIGTESELPVGEIGEICIAGPTVMHGYLDNPEETASTLRTHEDGLTWLHTGDVGYMDEDGFIYFRQRIKRMIVSSGYSIYPSQIENVIDAHEAVLISCVIGVPDPYKMQKLKAFVVLREGYEQSDAVRDSIIAHCKKGVAKYAMPYEFELRDSLPKTLVGKVAYTVLEKEEAEKAAGM